MCRCRTSNGAHAVQNIARRCLAPASSYCEPDTGKPAKWHWFAVNSDDDRELFAFPGIWQRWKARIKKDGPNVEIDTCAFMTTEPNALTVSINHERMPVLLSEESEFKTRLSGTPAEAFSLVRSVDPAKMQIVQSGLRKRICWPPDKWRLSARSCVDRHASSGISQDNSKSLKHDSSFPK